MTVKCPLVWQADYRSISNDFRAIMSPIKSTLACQYDSSVYTVQSLGLRQEIGRSTDFSATDNAILHSAPLCILSKQ